MKRVKDIMQDNEVLQSLPVRAEDKEARSSLKKRRETAASSPADQAEHFKCAVCQDRGIVLEGDVAYPCSCMQVRKVENQFRHARISRDLLKCRLEGFQLDYYTSERGDHSHYQIAARALKAAKGFVEECQVNPHTLGLMFTGPVGSGKTFLAAAIANALTDAQLQVLFVVVPDLLDELRGSYKSEVKELDLLDSARTIPVLILDDLGAHNYSDWTRNRIYSILNYRMNEVLPTIITTNLSLDEMEEYLGLRTTSRIIQMARIFRLTVEKDIRHQMYYEREGKK